MKFQTLYKDNSVVLRLRKKILNDDIEVFDLYVWISDLMWKFFIVGPLIIILGVFLGLLFGEFKFPITILLIFAVPITILAWFGKTLGGTTVELSFSRKSKELTNWGGQVLTLDGDEIYELLNLNNEVTLLIRKEKFEYLPFPQYWTQEEKPELWLILQKELEQLIN